MEKQIFNSCPLCGSPETTFYSYCTDFDVSKEQFMLLRCISCGLVFTDNAPDEQHMTSYDRLKHRLKLGDDPEGLTDRLFFRVRKIMLPRKARIVEKCAYRSEGSLMNYGAKTGWFSSYMEKKGWKVTSVENYHEERLFSLEMFHHRMIDVSEVDNLKPESFDVVTLWHVFEHSANPHKLLDTFHSLLRPGGILLIACPNIRSADALHYGPYWAAYNVPRHRWHFDAMSLTRLASRHSFTLMHHEILPFDSFYISILSERQMHHKLAFLKGMVFGFRSWMQSTVHRGRGSSIVYVFRKKNLPRYDQTKKEEED